LHRLSSFSRVAGLRIQKTIADRLSLSWWRIPPPPTAIAQTHPCLHALPRRRPHLPEQRCRRARAARDFSRAQIVIVRGLRWRRRARCNHAHADPERQLNDVDPQSWLATCSPGSPITRLPTWPRCYPGIGTAPSRSSAPPDCGSTTSRDHDRPPKSLARTRSFCGSWLRTWSWRAAAEDGCLWIYDTDDKQTVALEDAAISRTLVEGT
jgi:hypothetical protein